MKRAGLYNGCRTASRLVCFRAGVRYVAFLRAVNVGGRRVSMDRLRALFEELGFEGVSTYIASGNVVFEASGRAAELERTIEAKLEKALGFEVTTFLRRASEVRQSASEKPFGKVSAGKTHIVAFLRRKPTAAERLAIEERSTPADTLVVDGREVHWLIEGRMMDSELKPKDWDVLGQPTTTRNTTMLAKLAAKLDD
ncbi:MAG TPA: DUF1697 domain-containing protein [Gaiellaceae bacterium]|nr:DUF1697 domain-containing protein [Gaiellaceae bacterium]